MPEREQNNLSTLTVPEREHNNLGPYSICLLTLTATKQPEPLFGERSKSCECETRSGSTRFAGTTLVFFKS